MFSYDIKGETGNYGTNMQIATFICSQLNKHGMLTGRGLLINLFSLLSECFQVFMLVLDFLDFVANHFGLEHLNMLICDLLRYATNFSACC